MSKLQTYSAHWIYCRNPAAVHVMTNFRVCQRASGHSEWHCSNASSHGHSGPLPANMAVVAPYRFAYASTGALMPVHGHVQEVLKRASSRKNKTILGYHVFSKPLH